MQKSHSNILMRCIDFGRCKKKLNETRSMRFVLDDIVVIVFCLPRYNVVFYSVIKRLYYYVLSQERIFRHSRNKQSSSSSIIMHPYIRMCYVHWLQKSSGNVVQFRRLERLSTITMLTFLFLARSLIPTRSNYEFQITLEWRSLFFRCYAFLLNHSAFFWDFFRCAMRTLIQVRLISITWDFICKLEGFPV